MLFIDKNAAEPLYVQIYRQLQEEIVQGTLKEGDVLSGSRVLAKTLQVSRNTIDNAYSQLAAEGYITAKPGIGYLVTRLPPAFPSNSQNMEHRFLSMPTNGQNTSPSHIVFDLTNTSYTSDLFPKTMWKRYTLECLEQLEREARISAHLDPQGEWYLRHNLRLYLERIRGVHCKEQQIIITAGLQQSLEIVCKLLPKKNSTVFMEEPGYHKAAAVFLNNERMIKTIPVDEDGLIVSNLFSLEKACAVYTTPSHQFPTGVTMPVHRRFDLIRWALEQDTYILEDDFDSELRYYAKPIPSLQSIDTTDRVIYFGTFSKIMSPSVRMSYLILPPQLYEQYCIRFENYNSTVPLLNQYVIAKLLESGQYDRHIRRLNLIFRKRMEVFAEEFHKKLPAITITGNGSGQYFLLRFPASVDSISLIAAAGRHGVQVYSTMEFWQDKADCPPNTLFLGFSKIDLKDIPDCVNRLYEAWKNCFC